jgi:hypothetical protein
VRYRPVPHQIIIHKVCVCHLVLPAYHGGIVNSCPTRKLSGADN